MRFLALAVIAIAALPIQAQRQVLTFRPVQVQYSNGLDRIIAISGAPNRLHIYNPQTNIDSTVALSGAPLSLSVSPDGLHAAVGYAGSIDYVNLQSQAVEKTFTGVSLTNSYSSAVGQVVIGNGYIYLMPGYVGSTVSIQIATGVVTAETGLQYSSGGVFDSSANAVYATQDGVSPESLMRFDASTGPLSAAKEYSYFSDFSVCGLLQPSADLTKLFTGCGNIFTASSDPTKDMLYVGSLPGISQAQALATSSTGQVAAIPAASTWNSATDADALINIFAPGWVQTGSLDIPPYVASGFSNVVHGRWLFYRSDSSALYVLSQVDTSAALLNNFVLDTIALTPSSSCGTTFASASASAIATGGYATVAINSSDDCLYKITSSVPWIVASSYPMGSGSQTLTYLVRGNTGGSRTGTINIGSQSLTVTQDAVGTPSAFNPLSFNVVGADYSQSLDRMILVSASPNELHVYDPSTQTDSPVTLPAAPLSLSVSPDGKSAVVGHDGSLSYVDLQLLAVSKTIPVPGVLRSVALGGNGYAYCDNATGGDSFFPSLYSVQLSSGTVTSQSSGYLANGNLRVNPGLDLLYTGGLAAFDISGGAASQVSTAYSNPGFGGGNLWLSGDGSLTISDRAQVFYTSDVPSLDLALDGTLNNTNSVKWAAESGTRQVIAVIPNATGAPDTQLQIYAENGLQLKQQTSLPQFTAGTTSTTPHGQYLFWNVAQDTLYAITQADSSANLLSSYGEATISFASIPACSFAVSPQTIYVSSQTSNFFVNVTTACTWTATYPAYNWLFNWSGGGYQEGSQQLSLEANANVNYATPSAPTAVRSETFTVAGLPVTVTQAASSCVYLLSSTTGTFSSNGGTATVNLSVGSGCQWTLQTSQPWITVIGGSSGSGPATIRYSVSPNPTGASRVGVLYIAGLLVSISQNDTPPLAQDFVPVTPCRVVDTRLITGPLGGPFLAGGMSRDFPIPSSSCGIPTTAGAYSLNVTVVPHGHLGYVTVWPTGTYQPTVSLMNSLDGRIKADAAIIQAGTSGEVSMYATNDTDLVIDIDGYFVPSPATNALEFYPVTPCRVVDTRGPAGSLGGPVLGARSERDFPIPESSCGLPSIAQAYSLNFTAIPQSPHLGYLSVWPTGQTMPVVSTLNALNGGITANAAIVPAGTNGAFSAYVTDNAHLAVDVNGYFAAAGSGGLHFYAIQPCRALDTRSGSITAFSGIVPIPVSGAWPCQVPSTAQAYVINATVLPSTGYFGYLSLWPDGTTQPVVSTLNALDGAFTSNLAIVPSIDGLIDAYATDKTDLLLDITGYFAP